ncbi:aminoglycoside phosphotransferase [Mycobacterium antarcticum]|uniref:phosphotransferase family protein n=1 Tax=unclassified Mycolicibacterium TaxID=2636767 RepID=UPI00238B7457|nr:MULTISPECIES: phosphotransferase [unclassified Mycolicibacterium]BDX29792.1 aminoglycoside phosphotransferase [Mycolicibacterium sp. TUM20985]GLP73218.1 aminoglycoside phosphotransferase [Mycolicibacterium sp. TUM20983]
MPDARISFEGDVVLKVHRAGTDLQGLRRRLLVAARSDALASPLQVEPEQVGDRWLTRWPRLDVVRPEPVDLPWARAGEVLARLHNEPVGDFSMAHGARDRLRRALARLGDGHDSDVIRRAAAGLDFALTPDRPVTLVHGDFHLGQLGRDGVAWRLIDVDDLGIGDPAWDLARPAGFWAAGLVPDDDWERFVDGYRGAGGPALPDGDPWSVLERVARVAVVTAAANHPDDELLVEACARMA